MTPLRCLWLGTLSGCFLITDADVREHDRRLADADADTDTDTDTDADSDSDADADTDADTDTDTVDTAPTDTGTPIEGFTLDVFGQSFWAWEGLPVVGRVTDTQGTVHSTAYDTIANGTFGFRFPDPLPFGGRYRVDVLVDGNGDGSCDVGYGGYTGYTYTYQLEASYSVLPVESPNGDDVQIVMDAYVDYDPSGCDAFP